MLAQPLLSVNASGYRPSYAESDRIRLLLQIPHSEVANASEPQVYHCPILNCPHMIRLPNDGVLVAWLDVEKLHDIGKEQRRTGIRAGMDIAPGSLDGSMAERIAHER